MNLKRIFKSLFGCSRNSDSKSLTEDTSQFEDFGVKDVLKPNSPNDESSIRKEINASETPKENNEKLELIHVMPGAKIPQHTHEGNESFLVLHGSYSDEYGSYNQGSVQVRSDDHDHTPVGHAQTGCIGLAYTHGKIKFSGKFGKLLNLIAN